VKYSAERKEAVLKKMLPPNNKPLSELSKEEGISEATLYNWRKGARAQGRLLPKGSVTPEGWSAKDRFGAVIETAAMNEAQLGEYCRQRGLYPEQVKAWRLACEQATTDWERESVHRLSHAVRGERKRNKVLERELARKERALAEAAALLVLRKKAQAIWGEGEDA
jgi:transposase-like protein